MFHKFVAVTFSAMLALIFIVGCNPPQNDSQSQRQAGTSGRNQEVASRPRFKDIAEGSGIYV